MDTELGKLILKQVDTFPKSFNMTIWGMQDTCGTVACLAGHAMLLSGYRLLSPDERISNAVLTGNGGQYERPDGSIVNGFYGEEAQGLLQMTDAERHGDDDGDIFMDYPNGLARFRGLLEGA